MLALGPLAMRGKEMDADVTDPAARARELGAFLTARRAAVLPADVGLPSSGRRRVVGLRREEVALLAGVSHTWYMELEQGRNVRPTGDVVDAIARALRLDQDETRHLRYLSSLPPEDPPAGEDKIGSSLQRLVDQLSPWPAFIADIYLDLYAWNRGYTTVFRRDPSSSDRQPPNVLYSCFMEPDSRESVVRWEQAARRMLAQFRGEAGRHPSDPRFQELVDLLLLKSEEFRAWWPEYNVRSSRPGLETLIWHPAVGQLRITLVRLHPSDAPHLTLFAMIPADDVEARSLAELDLCSSPTPGRPGAIPEGSHAQGT
jgi:transcriptional regulator with XRE-family HTH domain